MAVIENLEPEKVGEPEFAFHCPGCGFSHWFKTKGKGPCWTFNGDMDKPTIHPSLRVRYGQEKVCHSFIKEGIIEFCNDCTHDLVGQKVPLEPEL